MRRPGYTLVELLLVIVVLAVAASVLVLAQGNAVPSRKLKGDATSVVALLRQARASAIGRSTRTRVAVDEFSHALVYELVEDPLVSLDVFVAPKGLWGEPVKLNEDVTLEIANRDTGVLATEVVFRSNGEADPVDILLAHPKVKERMKIQVDSFTGMADLKELLEGQE